MSRVLLVDDHPVVREGLRAMLTSEPGIEVVSEASNGEEAVTLVEALEPDVVLMDIYMSGVDGIEATRRIKAVRPTTPVIMLTVYDSEIYVIEAVRAGAAGYLTKDCSRDLLCHAIRTVMDGGTVLRTELLRRAMRGLVRGAKEGPHSAEVDDTVLDRLTPREVDVLRLLAQGFGNRDICGKLFLADVTVKKHVQNVIAKLSVSDRTQAALLGVRLGLITEPGRAGAAS